MTKINSRRKGKVAELEVAKILRKHGYDARRSQQYSGAAGDADVIGLPKIHLEVKRVERMNLYDALKQAQGDCKDDNLPVVVHRKNHEEWVVIQPLDDWLELHKAWAEKLEENKGW